MISRDKLETRLQAIERAHRGRGGSEVKNIAECIADCYKPLHEDIQANAHRYYNLPGGRGSCKSSFVSLEIVYGIMRGAGGNAIIFRKVAGTMRDSVFSQIAWAIDMLGVSHLWKATVSPMQYEYMATGAQILFRGLDDASKLKSIKPRRGVFRFVWFEEFSELNGANFARNVLQSVVRGQGEKPIIFRSFNPPISAANWANQFILEPDARAITLHTDYTMIPAEWLGVAFIEEAERLREINPKAYEHEYMGVATGTGAEVFPALEVREISAEEIAQQDYIFYGVDFGFASDPVCFIRCSYDCKHETIYVTGEIYKRGLSNKELAEEIKQFTEEAKQYTLYDGEIYEQHLPIFCDSAEPKSIRDLMDCGLRQARACHKFAGCVQYRIKWMQHRRIIIDPVRTPNAAREFSNYEYEKDKDGNIMASLPDKDNHTIDALAYALDREIYTKRGQSA